MAFGHPSYLVDGHNVLLHASERAEQFEQRWREARGERFRSRPWLDHWGSTTIDGEVCFVSEPYLTYPPAANELAVPQHIADATGCDLLVERESEWNPPSTIRLVFRPKVATLEASRG
jgi:hypothetical protein